MSVGIVYEQESFPSNKLFLLLFTLDKNVDVAKVWRQCWRLLYWRFRIVHIILGADIFAAGLHCHQLISSKRIYQMRFWKTELERFCVAMAAENVTLDVVWSGERCLTKRLLECVWPVFCLQPSDSFSLSVFGSDRRWKRLRFARQQLVCNHRSDTNPARLRLSSFSIPNVESWNCRLFLSGRIYTLMISEHCWTDDNCSVCWRTASLKRCFRRGDLQFVDLSCTSVARSCHVSAACFSTISCHVGIIHVQLQRFILQTEFLNMVLFCLF